LPRGVTLEEYKQKTIKPVQLKVINIIKSWIETSYFDFDNKFLCRLGYFIDVAMIEDNHEQLAKQLRNGINKRTEKTVRRSRLMRLGTFTTPDKSLNKVIAPSQVLKYFETEDIARQLTIIDSNTFSLIKPAELLNQAWNKPELKHRAGNVLYMIERFNQVSSWASSCILMQDNIADRVTNYQKLINVAEHLRVLNNFNSMLAIVSGLNNSAVYRLNYTRAELSEKALKTFDDIMQLMKTENSYRNYREALHNANPPIIPYLGVYLTDFTFIEVGNKDFLGELINFRKREQVAEIIFEIQLYQQGNNLHTLKPHPKLVSLLNQLSVMDDTKLYELSMLREPRNAERTDLT